MSGEPGQCPAGRVCLSICSTSILLPLFFCRHFFVIPVQMSIKRLASKRASHEDSYSDNNESGGDD
jgi:hypothetical protein